VKTFPASGAEEPVAASLCSGPAPATAEACTGPARCAFTYVYSRWSQCEADCPGYAAVYR
jgi:hypothetical protein